jgi:hypothetical protein
MPLIGSILGLIFMGPKRAYQLKLSSLHIFPGEFTAPAHPTARPIYCRLTMMFYQLFTRQKSSTARSRWGFYLVAVS